MESDWVFWPLKLGGRPLGGVPDTLEEMRRRPGYIRGWMGLLEDGVKQITLSHPLNSPP